MRIQRQDLPMSVEGIQQADSKERTSLYQQEIATLSPVKAAKHLIGMEQLDLFYKKDGKAGLSGPAAAGVAMVAATAAVAAATVQAVATLAAAKSSIEMDRPLGHLNLNTQGMDVDQLLNLRNMKV